MGESNNSRNNQESALVETLSRWLHAITRHFMFLVFLGCMHWIGLMPVLWTGLLFLRTSNWRFAIAFFVLAGIPGVIWTAIHRMVWSLQFGFPIYLFQELWKSIILNFHQGWRLGMIFAFLGSVIAAPIYTANQYQQMLPFGIICLMAICMLLFLVISSYTYYQVSRYELTILSALRNSVLLLFNMGWRSIPVCLIWIVLICGIILVGHVVLPLCMFCGLTIILCITEQAIFVPRIDKLFSK